MSKEIVDQGGAVVYRINGGRPEILLIRAKKTPQDWVFPKGHIEPGESSEQTAVRETREEAGVEAKVVLNLSPPLIFPSGKTIVRVRYYLLEAVGETTPQEQREKQWLSPAQAIEQLTHPEAKQLLRTAMPFISQQVD